MPNTNSEALLCRLNQSSHSLTLPPRRTRKGNYQYCTVSSLQRQECMNPVKCHQSNNWFCHHLILEIQSFKSIFQILVCSHSYPTMWHTSLQLSPFFYIAGSWHERGLQGAGFVSVASQERQSFNVQKRRYHHRARPAGIVVVWRTRWKGGFWLDGILLSVLVIQFLHTSHQLCIIIIIIIISRNK